MQIQEAMHADDVAFLNKQIPAASNSAYMVNLLHPLPSTQVHIMRVE